MSTDETKYGYFTACIKRSSNSQPDYDVSFIDVETNNVIASNKNLTEYEFKLPYYGLFYTKNYYRYCSIKTELIFKLFKTIFYNEGEKDIKNKRQDVDTYKDKHILNFNLEKNNCGNHTIKSKYDMTLSTNSSDKETYLETALVIYRNVLENKGGKKNRKSRRKSKRTKKTAKRRR